MVCAFGMEACKQYFHTKYVRLLDLLIDLEIARIDGNYRKVMAKYANPLVLVLDKWLLLKPTESEQKGMASLTVSYMTVIVSTSQELMHDIFMREVYGLDKALRE